MILSPYQKYRRHNHPLWTRIGEGLAEFLIQFSVGNILPPRQSKNCLKFSLKDSKPIIDSKTKPELNLRDLENNLFVIMRPRAPFYLIFMIFYFLIWSWKRARFCLKWPRMTSRTMFLCCGRQGHHFCK